MVLDNIAMVRSHPGALPWGVKLAQGSVTIRDNLESLFAITWPFTRRTAEVFGSRYWTESWTTVPVVDADQLNGLQAIYANSAYAPWIQAGVPTEAGAPTGHYGLEIVWVRSKDIGELTKLTLQVLRAAPIKPGERAFLVPGPPPSF